MTSPASERKPTVICPKCQGEMRQYERNGVTIDQCAECRGIFLDRGELEALLDANDAYYRRSGGGDPGAAADEDRGSSHGESSHGGSRHGDSGYSGQGRKRRGGFLGGLFDD